LGHLRSASSKLKLWRSVQRPRDYNKGLNQFFFSSYFVRLNNLSGGNRPIEDLTLAPDNYVTTVGWTRIINSVLVNEARFNFTRFAFNQLQPSGLTDYGIPQIRLFDLMPAALAILAPLWVSAPRALLPEVGRKHIRFQRHCKLDTG